MKPVKIDEAQMIDLYVNKKLTAKACAIRLGVSQSALVRRLRKLGIDIRPPTRRLITDIDNNRVVDLYWNQKLSTIQIAKILGRSEHFIKGRLEKSGKGLRSLSNSARQRSGTADITDEQLIYLHDIRGWPCSKISEHFNKSADFVRQRFIVIGKARRNKIGKNNPAYKDGRTPLRTRIRDCAKSLVWKQACMERDNYTCQYTCQYGNLFRNKLEVHHLKSFSQIFEEFLYLNSDLDPEKDCDQLFELSQYYDPFWDVDNGITLSEVAHHTIHAS